MRRIKLDPLHSDTHISMWRRLYTEKEIWEGRIMGMSQKDIPRHDHHPPDDVFAIKCSSSSSVTVINFTSNKMKLFRTDLTLRRDRNGMPEGLYE